MTFASYSAGQPAIYAMTSSRRGQSQLAAYYAALVQQSAAPDAGNVDRRLRTCAVPGAAGGTDDLRRRERHLRLLVVRLARHDHRRRQLTVTGSPKTQITEIITREMRAYAEH